MPEVQKPPSGEAGPVPRAADPAAWVEQHGDALYRYALLHLGQADAAEDIVQETFLGALRTHAQFADRASERTWLISILRKKIVDHLRRRARQPVNQDPQEAADTLGDWFHPSGKWKRRPGAWHGDPAQALDRQEFWEALAACLSRLPPRLMLAFSGREFEQRDTPQLCELLEVSVTNLWTLLHRARTRLRACLEANWFGRKDREDEHGRRA